MREDGIVNFGKKKSLHNIYENFAGFPAELWDPLKRGFTSITFLTNWGTFLSRFPVPFWWIFAFVRTNCDASLDGTGKKCNSIIQLLTTFFQALFGTWWSVILEGFQFIGMLFHTHQWHPFTLFFQGHLEIGTFPGGRDQNYMKSKWPCWLFIIQK